MFDLSKYCEIQTTTEEKRTLVVEAALEIINNISENILFPLQSTEIRLIGEPDKNIINILADQIEEALKVKDA